MYIIWPLVVWVFSLCSVLDRSLNPNETIFVFFSLEEIVNTQPHYWKGSFTLHKIHCQTLNQ